MVLPDLIIYQDTIRVRGANVACDAVRIGSQTFIISGSIAKTASLERDKAAWLEDLDDPASVIRVLTDARAGVDIFRFSQRIPDSQPKYSYYKEWRHVAAIPVSSYNNWLEKQISSKARNKIRKTQKFGVTIQEHKLNDDLVRGVMDIFNQSPTRRGKRFWHYGKDFETVKNELALDLQDSIFVTAYHRNELIGFVKLLLADRYAIVTLILDKLGHRDKAPMNGMIAKAVEICATRKVPYIVYMMWRRGGHGQFQESNGFEKISIPEYFVPLTLKGEIALCLGLHKGLKGAIPEKMMVWLLSLRSKWYSMRYPEKTT
jgi:hypothetical protein